MVADLCVHNTKNENPHCHVLLTMRPFNDDKSWGNKQKKVYIFDSNGDKIYDPKKRQYKCSKIQTTDWNERTKAEEWRKSLAEITNKYLEKFNHSDRVDHRSYARQNLEKIPTVHMGVAACRLEQHGIKTERGDINRRVKEHNRLVDFLKRRINRIRNVVANLFSKKEEFSDKNIEINIVEILKQFHENGGLFNQPFALNIRTVESNQSLKNVSKAIDFLEKNNISTVRKLKERLSLFRREYLMAKRQGERNKCEYFEDGICQIETIWRSELLNQSKVKNQIKERKYER